jgi:hypothetical protein
LYGERGDPIRAQIQKKVYRWSLLETEGSYEQRVLNRFQVKSFATNQLEKRSKERKKKGQTVESSGGGDDDDRSNKSSSESSSSTISSDESAPTKTPSLSTKRKKEAPKTKPVASVEFAA